MKVKINSEEYRIKYNFTKDKAYEVDEHRIEPVHNNVERIIIITKNEDNRVVGFCKVYNALVKEHLGRIPPLDGIELID